MELVTVCNTGSKQIPIPVGSKVESTNKYGTVPSTEPLSTNQIILSAPITKGNIQPRYDYMGYILVSIGHTKLSSHKENKPVKTISDLNLMCHPFTQMIRGKVIETDLACNILRLTPSPESEQRLVGLLADYYDISFED